MNPITSVPITSSMAVPTNQRQAGQLLGICLEASHIIANSVDIEVTEDITGIEKSIKTQVVIDGSLINGELVSSLSDQLKGSNGGTESFLRSVYSLTQHALTYLDFLQQRGAVRYQIAQVREESVQDGFRFRPFYLDFAYHQVLTKSITASIATFLGMYLDPLLPGGLRQFVKPLENDLSPDEFEKNIWHHPHQLGFGAVLALNIFLKPAEYETALHQSGFIHPETSIAADAINIGPNYLDGLRNQGNPLLKTTE